MKKSVLSCISVVLVLALTLTGCRTTSVAGSGVKGKGAKVKTAKTEIIDYQGRGLGKEIPEWVVLVAEGQYDPSVLSKVMPGLEGKKVFVSIGQGDNLEFVRNWTEMVDMESHVADTMQRVVGKAVSGSMKGYRSSLGGTSEPTESNESLEKYVQALSAVELHGLERTASYWIQIRRYDKDDKNKYQDYYEYYAVWSMDKKIFDAQLEAALKNVDNDSETDTFRKTLFEKLANATVCSNSESLNDDADAASR